MAGNLTDLLTVPLDVAAEKTEIDLSSLSSNISSILIFSFYHQQQFVINLKFVMQFPRLLYIFMELLIHHPY